MVYSVFILQSKQERAKRIVQVILNPEARYLNNYTNGYLKIPPLQL